MKTLKILIAEDNIDIVGMYILWAPHFGEVTFVTNGLAAIAALETGKFDLVITDHEMTNSDPNEWSATGIEVIKECRRMHPKMKVIFTSGTPDMEVLADARNLGAEVVPKKDFGRIVSILENLAAFSL